MPVEVTPSQRATLRAVCDTFVPSLPHPDDPDGFWARAASDVGTDEGLAAFVAELPADQAGGLLQLLDVLAAQGFVGASQLSREQLLRNVSLANRDAAGGVGALGALTLFFTYGGVDALGQNPAFKTFGYPGPVSAPRATPKPIAPLVPAGDTTLEADVVVVGSGAGGGVVAGELARAGLKVVVLEAGGYFTEQDFPQVELWAYQNLYYRGGPTPTADQNVSLQAGSALGGGTVVNWTNSLKTTPWVRAQWAEEFGLADVATPAWDEHLDAVWKRSSINGDCSDLNPAQQSMQRGAERLGWSFRTTDRNTDRATYDPVQAGYMGFGDQSGSKRSTDKTFLVDAVEHGADVLVGCWAERVLVEGGRASGVEATWSDRTDGRTAKVTVRAPHVVVAAGALESPALLLRSGIGGPAVGRHLRLHPCTATFGFHNEDQQAWWGAPHAGLVDEHANVEDGYGFLLEGAQYTTAVAASAVPFTTAEAHKRVMADFRYGATLIGLLRDHGGGRVTIDEQGMAVHHYDLEADALDVRNTHRAIAAQVRLHEAAGAHTILALGAGLPRWRRGDDLEAYVAQVQRVPLRYGGMRIFAAHQMGSCRMGLDPSDSVANPDGELHDTPGVWIGDTSAFPTSSGTNPMLTCMTLAHRTASRIAVAAGTALVPTPVPVPA